MSSDAALLDDAFNTFDDLTEEEWRLADQHVTESEGTADSQIEESSAQETDVHALTSTRRSKRKRHHTNTYHDIHADSFEPPSTPHKTSKLRTPLPVPSAPLTPKATPKRLKLEWNSFNELTTSLEKGPTPTPPPKSIPSLLRNAQPPLDNSAVFGVTRSAVMCMYASLCAMRRIPCEWREGLAFGKAIEEKLLNLTPDKIPEESGSEDMMKVELFGINVKAVRKEGDALLFRVHGLDGKEIDSIAIEWQLRESFGGRFKDVRQAISSLVALLPMVVLETQNIALLGLIFMQESHGDEMQWNERGTLDLRAIERIRESFLNTGAVEGLRL
ncbi:hypothetical protein BC829DRAFT_417201 [Chytridium lagenaria]|nr:hypothetical protein BC829DRAFT_417201 [Chytridium lagenaria]